ncbi:MAG: carbohydrate kinase [Kineosporiaceae bacterium]|nr:carbohydrate kinase [Aeromicrobium sp.]
MTVLVVGESLVDVVTRAGGEESRRAGGSPFNVAVGVARLGITTRLATQMGTDTDGELLRQALIDSGVSVLGLAPQPSRTATAKATIAADGSASYEFDVSWDPAELPAPTGFEAVHVGSIGATLSPGADRVAGLVADAAAAGIPVTFDPNVRLGIQDDVAELRRRFDAIAPRSAVIKMSDEDAAALFPGHQLDDLVTQLAALGPLVAITRGGEGAIIRSGGNLVEVAAPRIEVVDTIGAGDSFMAALIAGLAALSWPRELSSQQLGSLGALASGAATITCMRPGADPPRRSELQELFAGLGG